MTNLSKPVHRVTAARRHEKSKTRAVILSLEPPARIGVRLQGTRETFRLDAESVYELAVQAHEREIVKRARRVAQSESLSMRKALIKARRECKGLLK